MDIFSDKWADRFLDLSISVSQWSKDPHTKVGAFIIGPDGEPVSYGFNGLPMGVKDLPERYTRPLKYKFIAHAERNALDLAPRSDLSGCALFTTHYPCPACATSIIQKKIKYVITFFDKNGDFEIRYQDDIAIVNQMFLEANVTVLCKERNLNDRK